MPDTIKAQCKSIYSEEVEDVVTATWSYPEFEGNFEISWSSEKVRKATMMLQISGSLGKLNVLDDEITLFLDRPFESHPAGRSRLNITSMEQSVPFDLAGPYYTRQLIEWVRAIKINSPYRNTLKESIDNHVLIDAMKNSNGQEVSIKQSQGNVIHD